MAERGRPMHLRFRWDDNEGCARIDPKSLESIQAMFVRSPVTVLDFLADVNHAVVEEYDDALDGLLSQARGVIDARYTK